MEVKMTMEEYKQLEEAKQDYEILKMHIRQCADVKEEYSKAPIGFAPGTEYRRSQQIILDKNNVLIDGFCSYYIAQVWNMTYVKIRRVRCQR